MISPEAIEKVIDFERAKESALPRYFDCRLSRARNNQTAFLNLIRPVFQAIESHPDSHQESAGNSTELRTTYLLSILIGDLKANFEASTLAYRATGQTVQETLMLIFSRRSRYDKAGVDDQIDYTDINGYKVAAELRRFGVSHRSRVEKVCLDLSQPTETQVDELISDSFLTILSYFAVSAQICHGRTVHAPVDYLIKDQVLPLRLDTSPVTGKAHLYQ